MTTLDHTMLGRWRLSPISFVEGCLCDPETSEPFVLLEPSAAFSNMLSSSMPMAGCSIPSRFIHAQRKSGRRRLVLSPRS